MFRFFLMLVSFSLVVAGCNSNTHIEKAAKKEKKINIVEKKEEKLDKNKLVLWVMKNSLKGKMHKKLAEDIVDACLKIEDSKHTLLLLSLIKTESNFYIFNKSSAGAVGLGQFMPDTINYFIRKGIFKEKSDVYNPRKAIPAIYEWLKVKGMDKDGSNAVLALYWYVGGEPTNKKKDRIARKYVQDIERSIGELNLFLKEKKNRTLNEALRKVLLKRRLARR